MKFITLKRGCLAILSALLSLQIIPALAVQSEDTGSWLNLVGEDSLKNVVPNWEKGRIWLEGQSHWENDWANWSQGLLRAALGYSLSDHATIWAGYTYLPTHIQHNATIQQQDVWPAFRYVLPTSYGVFVYRLMFEANFIPNNHGNVRFRPRQLFRFSHSLDSEPKLNWVVWDEVWIKVNSTPSGGQSGFDQNRAFVGLAWNFTPTISTEFGYLNQYSDDARHQNTVVRHLAVITVLLNF